jgi:hypothetical protein
MQSCETYTDVRPYWQRRWNAHQLNAFDSQNWRKWGMSYLYTKLRISSSNGSLVVVISLKDTYTLLATGMLLLDVLQNDHCNKHVLLFDYVPIRVRNPKQFVIIYTIESWKVHRLLTSNWLIISVFMKMRQLSLSLSLSLGVNRRTRYHNDTFPHKIKAKRPSIKQMS